MVSIRRENKNPQMAACHNVLVFPLYCRYIPKGTNQMIFPKNRYVKENQFPCRIRSIYPSNKVKMIFPFRQRCCNVKVERNTVIRSTIKRYIQNRTVILPLRIRDIRYSSPFVIVPAPVG